MSALVQRALREPVPFDRDIPGKDRRALEVLVAAGVLKKERQGKITVFAPVVTLAEFRKPKRRKKTNGAYRWAVVHFADGIGALVGSYSGREAEQAIWQRRRALGSFRHLAPESDVPAVVTIEPLAEYDNDIAEACYEQKYVNPGWGKSLTEVPHFDALYQEMPRGWPDGYDSMLIWLAQTLLNIRCGSPIFAGETP